MVLVYIIRVGVNAVINLVANLGFFLVYLRLRLNNRDFSRLDVHVA